MYWSRTFQQKNSINSTDILIVNTISMMWEFASLNGSFFTSFDRFNHHFVSVQDYSKLRQTTCTVTCTALQTWRYLTAIISTRFLYLIEVKTSYMHTDVENGIYQNIMSSQTMNLHAIISMELWPIFLPITVDNILTSYLLRKNHQNVSCISATDASDRNNFFQNFLNPGCVNKYNSFITSINIVMTW